VHLALTAPSDDAVDAVYSGTYWAFATNGNDSNMQSLTSKDLIRWELGRDALPDLAGWSNPGKVWAPDVDKVRVGYVL